MHAKDPALYLAIGHPSVDANYPIGTGKGPWVFRGMRDYFLKRDPRVCLKALASELAIEENIEFGCAETGAGGGSGEEHSRIEALVPPLYSGIQP